MPLMDLWRNSPSTFDELTIEQIVPMAGNGILTDGSQTSEELRAFLSEIERKSLRKHAVRCLSQSFPNGGLVLQDIINEAGRRLGLEVTNGNYRGAQNNNNCDGIWRSSSWTFVVEVKTTDAYSISLAKIAGYLTNATGTDYESNASCLIVVGRQDTGTLEDQLRGSKHNWKMRIVGVEALFSALELWELTEDKSLRNKIIDLLIPQEFTRVDKMISTAYDFATDQEEARYTPSVEDEMGEKSVVKHENTRRSSTNLDLIEDFKVTISKRMSARFNTQFSRNRSSFESSSIRYTIAVSKNYEPLDRYWYAYNPRQKEFLSEAEEAYFILGCLDTQKAFAIPYKEMNKLATQMSTTTPKGDEAKKYHHVEVKKDGDRHYIYISRINKEIDINNYEI